MGEFSLLPPSLFVFLVSCCFVVLLTVLLFLIVDISVKSSISINLYSFLFSVFWNRKEFKADTKEE